MPKIFMCASYSVSVARVSPVSRRRFQRGTSCPRTGGAPIVQTHDFMRIEARIHVMQTAYGMRPACSQLLCHDTPC
ncbi:hypothetical protein K100096D8_16950 [Eggerthella lenta]